MKIANVKITAAYLLVAFTVCYATNAEGSAFCSSADMHFSAEDTGVERPVPIPDGVLTTLKADVMVRAALENENIPTEKIPLSWFSASAINLSASGNSDLLVVAEGPLRGSNVTTFWVFRAATGSYELVLTASAHDLILKNARWRGHREIEIISMTALQISTVLCRFDGKRYKEYRVQSEPITKANS